MLEGGTFTFANQAPTPQDVGALLK
jgi:hypothetical protein